MKKIFTILFLTGTSLIYAQDTFSIVAVDLVTGEVGSAGASCLDLYQHFSDSPISFISNLIPAKGAINTQAAYHTVNQENALQKMKEGLSPSEIIDWLVDNDVNSSDWHRIRQYGIVDLHDGGARVKAFTGDAAFDYKGHIEGDTYSIQGNILSGAEVLESMKSRFENEEGSLTCKLMASLQGANIVGADNRCFANGTSSLFAFLKVSKPTDTEDRPFLELGVKTANGEGIEPIDLLQKQFDEANISCPSSLNTKELAHNNSIVISPNPAYDFISINSSVKFDEIEIFNAEGKLVKKTKIANETDKIDVSNLNVGVYLIKIYKNKKIIKSTKFIKK